MTYYAVRLLWILALVLTLGARCGPLLDLRNAAEFTTFEEVYRRAQPDIEQALSELTKRPYDAAHTLMNWFISWRNLQLGPEVPLADVYLQGIRKVFRPKFHEYDRNDPAASHEAAAMLYFLRWQWNNILDNKPTPKVLRDTLEVLYAPLSPFQSFSNDGYRHLAEVALDGEAFRIALLRTSLHSERQVADLCLGYFNRTGAKGFEGATTIERILTDVAHAHKFDPVRILGLMAEPLGTLESSENMMRAWLAYLRNINSSQLDFHLKRGSATETTVRVRLLLLSSKLPALTLSAAESLLLNDTRNKLQTQSNWRMLYHLEERRAGCAAKVINMVRLAP